MKVSLLHPFTPKAAGVVEKRVTTYHSQPHLKAMINLNKKYGYSFEMQYFTQKIFSYKLDFDNVRYRFFPVNFTINGDHKKWKKQQSKACIEHYNRDTPDVTIINMSGHSSLFSFELSKVILKNKKKYIPMLGGQHYSDNKRNREYYKNASHILVHTYMQKEAMGFMDLFKNCDIRVFPLGVNTNMFKPLVKKGKIRQRPKLLYVGRIVEWKRVHLAIEAVKELHLAGFKKASLDIIGPVVSEKYLNELKKLIIKFQLQDFVHFLGYKEHAELPEYFQNADLFTLPSDKETFGMVMIESMASGTPVAGINCPGGPLDVITNLKDGLLSSPENYTKEIVKFFKSPDLIETIRRQAIVKAVTDYGIEATTNVLYNSINATINE